MKKRISYKDNMNKKKKVLEE